LEPQGKLAGKQVLLGVSGSIAAYKAADLLRRLQEQGAAVRVMMTRNARRFVGPLTFEALSGSPVPDADFQDGSQQGIGHIDITEGLDLAVLAPATANIIGKLAAGIADDGLTTALMALSCPLIVAPAMNDRMYRSAALQHNIACLKGRGVRFVEPGTGTLACGSVGQGRLAETEAILRTIGHSLRPADLTGMTVLVTAGPTREPIDAVRFISNPSSGKMGYALAAECSARGAKVILVSGPAVIAPPRDVTLVPVITAAEMHQAVMEKLGEADIVIMAAAVSDFRPISSSQRKIKKQQASTVIELEHTTDILAAVGKTAGRRLLVGFAAETDDVIDHAVQKLKDKNLDLIVANDVLQEGAGFAVDTNTVTMIERSGRRTELQVMEKTEIASRILDKIVEIGKS
jgi:phosphopantothenoylcysteine decarboxylase/phosphopantothenate--cysteine ligase